MHSAFWTHTIWYVLLGMTTIVQLAVIFSNVQRKRLVLALYLTISGAAFIFEMSVLSYLKAYRYFPMLIPQSPSDDSIAGNLFSQFSVSATALLLAVFRVHAVWYWLFAAVYGVIEELFLAAGVYKHNWYRTWMTVAALPFLFWLAGRAYRACMERLRPVWRYLFIFLGLVTLHQHTVVWALRLAGVRTFSAHIVADKERSLVILSASYMMILGTAVMLLYFANIKWKWKLAGFLLLYLAHEAAVRFRLIVCAEGWFLAATSISIGGMYLYTLLLDKWYGQAKREPRPAVESAAAARTGRDG